MPTYTIQATVNVPSHGQKTFTQPGIVAPTIEEAMTQVKATMVVEIVSVIRTGQ